MKQESPTSPTPIVHCRIRELNNKTKKIIFSVPAKESKKTLLPKVRNMKR
jgi:hypothetical protein